MKCPILNIDLSEPCKIGQCLYNCASDEDLNCGYKMSVEQLVYHKGLPIEVEQISKEVNRSKERIKNCIGLYNYLEWLKEYPEQINTNFLRQATLDDILVILGEYPFTYGNDWTVSLFCLAVKTSIYVKWAKRKSCDILHHRLLGQSEAALYRVQEMIKRDLANHKRKKLF